MYPAVGPKQARIHYLEVILLTLFNFYPNMGK